MSDWRGGYQRPAETTFDVTFTADSPEILAETFRGARESIPGLVSLSMESKRKVWRFPPDRFVEYEESDAEWARLLGFGIEEEVVETVEIPRAVITGAGRNGISFRALPSGGQPFSNP